MESFDVGIDVGSTREYYSCWSSLQLLILSYQSLNDNTVYAGSLHSKPDNVKSEEVILDTT
jgi:hypothetical protein